MGTRHTDQNSEPPYGVKASLKSVIIHGTDEASKIGRWNDSSFYN